MIFRSSPIRIPIIGYQSNVVEMYWLCKCVIGLTLLATTTWSASLPTVAQKCVPPGPGLSLNDFLSGKFYLFERQQEFSIKLLQTAVTASPKQNLIFSPHSIYTALLITYFLSNNETEETLKRFLNIPPEQGKLSVMQAYRMEKLFHSMRALNTSADYDFSSVDRLFVSQRLPIQKCIADVFKDEVHKMDFIVDPELARMYINNWVTNQTNQQIKDLLPEGRISYETRLVLANAAYFKGFWSSKFSSESTKDEIFYTSPTENAYVPMMWQSGHFNLLSSDELGAHVLELPYKGGDISLFVILPPFNKQRGISQLTKRLNTNILQDIVSSGEWTTRPVEVSLPKFNVEQSMDNLVPILEQMGIGNMFKGNVDLSALTGNANDVTVDDVVHKAKISIDEEGTIAAAATAFIMSRSSRPVEPFKFRCNHPFIYFIFDKVTGSVLFMGVYNSPKSN